MNFKKYTFLIVAMLISYTSWCHALWIESNETGNVQKEHEVKVFYGEYAHGVREDFEGWYSNVEDFELWLITPDNKKVQLKCDSVENYFKTAFIPEKEGIYTLAISHSAKDLGGDYVYQFNASKKIRIGKAHNGLNNQPKAEGFYIQLKKDKKKDELSGTVYINNKPAGNTKVEIAAPGGWVKTVKTSDDGSFSVIPVQAGMYLLEASYTEDKTGEHYGKAYAHIWRCAVVTSMIP